jgi:hypothetical protein
MVAGRRDDVGDTGDHRHAAGEQHRPLVAELRTAAEGDDELRRTADGGPYAEDREDVRHAPGRGNAEGDGGDGADRGVAEQQLPSGSVLAPRVEQRGDHVDQRIVVLRGLLTTITTLRPSTVGAGVLLVLYAFGAGASRVVRGRESSGVGGSVWDELMTVSVQSWPPGLSS